MLTPDLITALAPDAASLKAGRGLATARKWVSAGGDGGALWGLAMGSGKEPYQTRVCLADFATKCSCPSRKFPCKHALGLMFLAASEPAALVDGQRPAWLCEWLDARSAREQKSAVRAEAVAAKPVDEKAAEKRRVQRDQRMDDGIALLRQALLDLVREGLAGGAARDSATWENLARRMIDAQAPGLAGALGNIADQVLRDPAVDEELPLELGRIFLILQGAGRRQELPEAARAEISALLGERGRADGAGRVSVEDEWLVTGRRVEERNRLISSATWLFGRKSRRWARAMRFAPVPQTIAEPWPIGSCVSAVLEFHPGLSPMRATPAADGSVRFEAIDDRSDASLDALLLRLSEALAANPFLRALPFLLPLYPVGGLLADAAGRALPWRAEGDAALRIECVCGGQPTLMAGEWDGRDLQVWSVRDGRAWIPITPQLP